MSALDNFLSSLGGIGQQLGIQGSGLGGLNALQRASLSPEQQIALQGQQAIADQSQNPQADPSSALLTYAKATGNPEALQKALQLKQLQSANLNDPDSLVRSGLVTPEQALTYKSNPNVMMMNMMGIGGGQNQQGAQPSSPNALPAPSITSTDLPPIGQTGPSQPSALSGMAPPPTNQGQGLSAFAPASPDDKRNYKYLSSLPAPVQGIVKGLSDGDENSGQQALKSPLALFYQQAAKQFDPGYSQTAYTARNKTAADFASGGKSGQAITSINTGTHHLAQVALAGLNLNNITSPVFTPTINGLKNSYTTSSGQDPVTNFNSTVDTVAPELAKAAAGGGETSVGDREGQKKDFDPNGSPAQILGAAAAKVQLLQGKAEELGNTYQKDMGHSTQVISPENLQTQKDIVALHGLAKQGQLSSPDAQTIIGRLKIAASDPSVNTPQQAAPITKVIGGQSYIKINGKWHTQ